MNTINIRSISSIIYKYISKEVSRLDNSKYIDFSVRSSTNPPDIVLESVIVPLGIEIIPDSATMSVWL